MNNGSLDRALVFAAEIEAASRFVFETDARERREAQEVMRNATGLRLALGRWIHARIADEQMKAQTR